MIHLLSCIYFDDIWISVVILVFFFSFLYDVYKFNHPGDTGKMKDEFMNGYDHSTLV